MTITTTLMILSSPHYVNNSMVTHNVVQNLTVVIVRASDTVSNCENARNITLSGSTKPAGDKAQLLTNSCVSGFTMCLLTCSGVVDINT